MRHGRRKKEVKVLLTLKEKRWLRALAKIFFEEEGYHTVFLEEIETFIKTQQEGGKK